MLVCALALFAQNSLTDYVFKLDELAKECKVTELSSFLAPNQGPNAFSPIKTGGASGRGRFGWRAVLLRMFEQSFVVFTTELTSEDIGELLFRIDEDGKLIYFPEDFTNEERIVSHDLNVRF